MSFRSFSTPPNPTSTILRTPLSFSQIFSRFSRQLTIGPRMRGTEYTRQDGKHKRTVQCKQQQQTTSQKTTRFTLRVLVNETESIWDVVVTHVDDTGAYPVAHFGLYSRQNFLHGLIGPRTLLNPLKSLTGVLQRICH